MKEISEARSERATPNTDETNFTIYSNLKLPAITSLDGIALASFLAGNRINHLAFQDDNYSYCLRANAFNLRQAGWPINDCWYRSETGRKSRYKKYFISNENIQILHLAIGERLTLFIEAVKGTAQ